MSPQVEKKFPFFNWPIIKDVTENSSLEELTSNCAVIKIV